MEPFRPPHQPSPRQRQFLALAESREVLYGGAAGGGKSDALLMAALQGMHVPGYAAMLFRRTYADLSLPGALMDRAHTWLCDSGWRWHDPTKTWHTQVGSSLSFGYLDGPRDRYRYQGSELTYVGFDELTQFEQRDYLYLASRLRRQAHAHLPVRLRAGTNPGGVGHRWVMGRFAIPGSGTREPIAQTIRDERVGDYQRVYVPALLADNPGLDIDDYRRSLAMLDTVTRRQLEEGIWVLDTSGLVYGFDETDHVVETLPALRPGESWRHVVGLDYGLRDQTAAVVLAWCDTQPTVYLVHAESHEGMLARDAAAMAQRLVTQYDPERVVGDGGGLGAPYVEEARRIYGIPIEPSQKSAKRGLQSLMAGALASGQLRVVRHGTDQWRAEASALLWEDERRLRENQSQDNHCCDAALYAWRMVRHYHVDTYEPPPAADDLELEAERRSAQRRSLRTNLGLRRVI